MILVRDAILTATILALIYIAAHPVQPKPVPVETPYCPVDVQRSMKHPLSGIIGGLAGSALAAAFGTEETPEAVGKAIAEDPDAAEKIQRLETERGQEILAQAQVKIEELKQQTEQDRIASGDRQDARHTQIGLIKTGSAVAWAPVVVSGVIIAGFIVISFLAMKPELAGVKETTTMYLLAAWQSLATMAAGYWLGSSSGSKDKDRAMEQMLTQAVAQPNPSPGTVAMVKAAAAGKKK